MITSIFLSILLAIPCQTEAVEEIDFPGAIKTKEEKVFRLPDGRKITVPIVNGYVPEINESRINGVLHRKFTFDTMTKYVGQTDYTKNPPKTEQPPVLPPVPIQNNDKKQIEDLQKQVKELQELLKSKNNTGRLKRPSEIKDNEAPTIIPKY